MAGLFGVNSIQPSMPVTDGGTQSILAGGANLAGQQVQPQSSPSMFSGLLEQFSDPTGDKAGEFFMANQIANLGNQMGDRGAINAILGVYGKPQLKGGQQNILGQLSTAAQGVDIQRERDEARKVAEQRFNTPTAGFEELLKNLTQARDISRQPFATGIYGRRR